MFLSPRFRFLVTNDDGINAPGLAALEEALPHGSEVIVIAPAEEHSGCGHQVTTQRSFRATRRGPRRFSVEGSPADCVRVAVYEFRDRFDWVLAGINHGANLGADIYYSGTVAAVREAALFGIPGIAISHYRDRVLSDRDWERGTEWVRHLLPELILPPQTSGRYWNLNLPCLPPGVMEPPITWCPVDTSPLQLDFDVDGDDYVYSGSYTKRRRMPGRDVESCFEGKIVISPLKLP